MKCIVWVEESMESDNLTLARRLLAAADEFERTIRPLSDAQWELVVPAEQRTIGQLVDHIAWAWEAESAAFRAIAGGASTSGWTQEWLDTQNAEQAQLSRKHSRREIMQHFHTSCDLARAFVVSLSPTDLARTGTHMPGEPERTVAGWIEACLIGHPREHIRQIQMVVERNRVIRPTGTMNARPGHRLFAAEFAGELPLGNSQCLVDTGHDPVELVRRHHKGRGDMDHIPNAGHQSAGEKLIVDTA